MILEAAQFQADRQACPEGAALVQASRGIGLEELTAALLELTEEV